jgi:hypothetical protein
MIHPDSVNLVSLAVIILLWKMRGVRDLHIHVQGRLMHASVNRHVWSYPVSAGLD